MKFLLKNLARRTTVTFGYSEIPRDSCFKLVLLDCQSYKKYRSDKTYDVKMVSNWLEQLRRILSSYPIELFGVAKYSWKVLDDVESRQLVAKQTFFSFMEMKENRFLESYASMFVIPFFFFLFFYLSKTSKNFATVRKGTYQIWNMKRLVRHFSFSSFQRKISLESALIRETNFYLPIIPSKKKKGGWYVLRNDRDDFSNIISEGK